MTLRDGECTYGTQSSPLWLPKWYSDEWQRGEEEEQSDQLEHWRVCIPFMLPPLLTLSSGLIPALPPALYPRLPLAAFLPPHPHNWNSLLKDWKGLSRPFCPVSCGHRKLILAGAVKQICVSIQREIKPWDETPLKRKTQLNSTEMGGCSLIVSVFCWISYLKVCVWLPCLHMSLGLSVRIQGSQMKPLGFAF